MNARPSLISLVCFVLLVAAWGSAAQDTNPTPIPTLAIDLFAGTPTGADARLARLPQISLKQAELPGGGLFNIADSANGVYTVEELGDNWRQAFPGNPLADSLRAAYINGGVIGAEIASFRASACGGLPVYALGSFVRAMTDAGSAQAFIVDITVPSLSERLFGWQRVIPAMLTTGNLYRAPAEVLIRCDEERTAYIYEYAYGPYVVGLLAELPASAPQGNAENLFSQLAPILNGRIDAAEGSTPLPTLAVLAATPTPFRDFTSIPTLASPGLAQAFVLQPDALRPFNATGGITNPGLLVQNPVDSSRYLITDALGLLFIMRGDTPARLNVSPFNDFIPATREVNQDIVTEAVWSPDGQYVAFVMDTTGNPDQSRTPDDGVWFFQPDVTWPMQYLISCPPGCGIVTRFGEPQEYKAVSAVWSPDSQYLLIHLELPVFGRGGFTVLERTFNEAVRNIRPPVAYYDHADWGIDGRVVVSGRAPGLDPADPAQSSRVILGTVNRDGSGEQIVLDGSANGLWLAHGTQRPQDDQPYAGEYLALGRSGGADGPMGLYDQRGAQITQVSIGQTRPVYVRWNADRTAVYVRTLDGRKFIAQISGAIIEITSAVGSVSAVGWPTGWQPPTAR